MNNFELIIEKSIYKYEEGFIYVFSKNKFLNFQIFSTIFTWILGTILHFTYEWSNENSIVAIFSAINESTWEHLKLLFFPMLITTIIGYFYLKPKEDYKNFLCAKTLGILASLSFVVVFFYTYTGIIGTNFAVLDIGSFFVGVLLGEFVSYKMTLSMKCCNKWSAVIVLIILLVCFITFTFYAPDIGLFRNPI